jgi:hypothetical protein
MAAVMPVAAALVVLTPSAVEAATCSGDTPTTLELRPSNAVAPVGDSHTVTAKETCGAPGSGDTIRFTIRGTNPQEAEGVTDADGVLIYSYWDDNGAGTDDITACTTGLTKNVCTTSSVTWECANGSFPSGVSCSRIPEFDLADHFDFTDRFADLNRGGAAPLGGLPLGGLPLGALPTGFSPVGGFPTSGFAP